MSRKRSISIIVVYVASLVVTIALLVSWIVYVLQSVSTINQLAGRLGGGGSTFHWVVLTVGCGLVGLLIAGLTFQLAQALSERNYSRRQEEFIANITHEMKSPLAAIKLHGQTLQSGDVSQDDLARSVGFILQQVSRLEKLVDNVLESGRLLARKQLHPPHEVDLAPFFERYFAQVRGSVESRGIRLTVDVATRAIVLASDAALDRVMTNLLENAVRFSFKGGEVRCRVRDERDIVRIEVEDDGIGIPNSELTKVFDRFYQIGREISERRGGTGLGLSIVAGLVGEMKGTVRALSDEDARGARFVVTLPIVRRRS